MSEILKKDKASLGLVHYELEMFRCMYDQLRTSNGISEGLYNAIIESFLVHTRNLIEFFHGTDEKSPYKQNCNDIIASDFRDEKGEDLLLVKWTDWQIMPENKQKINTYLSHLSQKRLVEDKNWKKESETFKIEIENKTKDFLKNISDEYFPIKIKEKEIIKTNFGKYDKAFCVYTIQNNGNKLDNSNSQSEAFNCTNSG